MGRTCFSIWLLAALSVGTALCAEGDAAGEGIRNDGRAAPTAEMVAGSLKYPKHFDLALALMPSSAKLAVVVDAAALRRSKALKTVFEGFFKLPDVQEGMAKLHEAFELDEA